MTDILGAETLDGVNPAIIARLYAALDDNARARGQSELSSIVPDRPEIERFVGAMFKYAAPATFVCLRSFDGKQIPSTRWVEAGGTPSLIDAAYRESVTSDRKGGNVVFCPPIATFRTKSAKTENLADGLVLSVDCDADPVEACRKLQLILGPPTIAVASGGVTPQDESKVHVHFRLSRPARTPKEYQLLHRARSLACDLIGADGSAKAIVHPLRWPGSVHKKASPRLARIVVENDTEIELSDAVCRLEIATKAAGIAVETGSRRAGAPTADPAKISAALAVIPNDRLSWENWNRVGMAAFRATDGDENGFEAFDGWSQRCPEKYCAESTRARWNHYASSPPDAIGAGTLFHLANETGIDWWHGDVDDAFEIESEDTNGPPTPGRVPGYSMRRNGLFRLSTDPDKPATYLCGRFNVLGMARDELSEQWGLFLGWDDPDGRPHTFLLDRGALTRDPSDCLSRLAGGGLEVRAATSEKGLLAAYLSAVRVSARIIAVESVGWQGACYVTPSKTHGNAERDQVALSSRVQDIPTRGTLQDWQQNLASLAVGNSRLAFAIAAAFAGPLIKLVDEESGGIHFKGDSSIGKTKLITAGASVWRRPVASWRTTDNAAEGLAVASNDGLLCLDEIGQGDSRAVDALAYMLANGAGKARSRTDSSNRPIKKFRLLFLSTGEVGLDSKISEQAGRRAKAGQEVRVLNIPADAGVGHGAFENLHGSANGAAFAERLARAVGDSSGHAADAFLEKLVSDLKNHIAFVETVRRAFVSNNCPSSAEGQVSRAAGRFGLIAAAGELAAHLGILPWPDGEASRSALACFRAWIAERGGTGAHEITQGVDQVRAFLAAHGASRFETMDNLHDQRVVNRVGFKRLDGMGRWEYYATPEGFKEITRGYDSKALANALAAAGLLSRDGQGKNSVAVNVPGYGKKRLYHFPAKDDANTEEAKTFPDSVENGFDDLDGTEGL